MPGPRRTTILVAVDEPVTEIGLRAVLTPDSEFEILASVATQPDLVHLASTKRPDVVLFHLNVDADLSVVKELRRVAPNCAVVLWAHNFSTELAYQALDMRVRGILSTTSSPESLKSCLKVSAGGQAWMEQNLLTELLNAHPVSLSKRQSEIIALLTQGLKNKEIAIQLGISEGTVKSYLTSLFQKVGAKDRFELALFGLRNSRGLSESMTQTRPGRFRSRPRRIVATGDARNTAI